MTVGILDHKIPRCCRLNKVLERQLVACDWAFTEIALIIDRPKTIMKPEAPKMSWMMSEKH